MRGYTLLCVFVVLVMGGCSAIMPDGQEAIMPGVRTIEAVRADEPPVIDGKLDDACWGRAKPVTDFVTIHTDRPAAYQSIGYVCYDETRLYIGMKCLMPDGGTPAGKPKPHDTYCFSDDIVEIMIDPGLTRTTYYQLVISAYGATFDTYRKGGGAGHDPAWNGDWDGAVHIGEGYWSAEMSVPFHNLGITPETGSTWGLNLCRETKIPRDELSSTGARGAFNKAGSFPVLKGLHVDFSKYLYQIGPGVTRLEPAGDGPRALFTIPVKNTTGKTQQVKIDRWYGRPGEEDAVESMVVTLRADESVAFSPERLDAEPFAPGRTDGYIIRSAPKTKKIVVSDAADGTIFALAFVQRPWFCESMRIQVEDPWRAGMSSAKTSRVSLAVHMQVDKAHRENGELLVTLVSKETGKTVARRRFTRPAERTDVSFPVSDLPWGAYDACASFRDAGGRELVSTKATATVLPGGKQRIKILNNLASELMNARERGLLGEREIAFMNPRDGWVFFAVTGGGRVTLDEENEPLGAVLHGQVPGEAMRLLRAGRHTLHVEGTPDQIVVRAIPELIFSCHPSGFTWDFLKKHVLPHCTSILGGTSDAPAMREWQATHRPWLTFCIAAAHATLNDVSYTAEEYYRFLLNHEGFKNPLTSGVMVDAIGGSALRQKVELAGTLSRVVADPNLAGRSYRPWYEGAVAGTDGDKAFMKVVMEAGWPFAYYQYLTEQSTEAMVKSDIQDRIVRVVLSAERQIPGSLRRAIFSPGYWSAIPSGQIQDIDPGANFKLLMQMQFEALANDPALFGMYGAFWYYSPYVDEEVLRWSAALHRHYGIEGKTTPLTTDPYRLKHIRNPDFEEGTDGWTIAAAETGTVRVGKLSGYGQFQGRYLGGTRGDTFLATKRSAKGPNAFSQDIKGLTPGKAYSFKMITADFGNISSGKSVNKKEAVSIRLDNVDLIPLPGKNEQVTFLNHYAHPLGKFRGKHNAYMNYHWYVFRAKASTAKVTVSDWTAPDRPGGPIGGEVMYNYIQIEPYFEGMD